MYFFLCEWTTYHYHYLSMFITVYFKEVGKYTGYCSNSAISHGSINMLIVFTVNFIFQNLFLPQKWFMQNILEICMNVMPEPW